MNPILQRIYASERTPSRALPKRRILSLSMLFLAGAVSIALLVLGILSLKGQGDQIEIEVQSVGVSETGTLSLVGARYSGRTDNGGRFNILAEEAIEGQPKAGQILLRQPDGFLVQNDGRRMDMQATKGVYDTKSNHLDLTGDVQITQSKHNLTLIASTLHAELDTGLLVSDQPVEVIGLNMLITAEGMNANEAEGRIIFTGHARLSLSSKDTPAKNR